MKRIYRQRGLKAPDDLWAEVTAAAHAEGMDVSKWVRRTLERALRERGAVAQRVREVAPLTPRGFSKADQLR